MKTVCVLSGGMDSTTLLYDLVYSGNEVKAISFDYNQRHKRELEQAAKTCKKLNIKLRIVDLTSITSLISNSALTGDKEVPEGHYADESMKATVVPNRNMIMASIAIGYAVNIGFDSIALGVHAGDHAIYPDCRPEFVEALENIAKYANYEPIKVFTPYIFQTKSDIVSIGIKLNVDFNLTHTCYKGGELACGKCGSCVERLESFAENKITDPIKYE